MGSGAPICYWKPAWNLFFISAVIYCVKTYNTVANVTLTDMSSAVLYHAAPWRPTQTNPNCIFKSYAHTDKTCMFTLLRNNNVTVLHTGVFNLNALLERQTNQLHRGSASLMHLHPTFVEKIPMFNPDRRGK